MILLTLIPRLPLLRRELTELANRPRTYVIRIVGALAVLTLVFSRLNHSIAVSSGYAAGVGMQQYSYAAGGSAVLQILGIGGRVFEDIVPLLFRLIQVMMPALCCGCITMEKEKNTLGTLLLTRLSPTAIVLEKLGSRLVPMFTFLLLTFPVLAYVYSLGGVDTSLLLGTIWLLFCECLLYASIAMVCSAWFKTTVAAFMCSYLLVAMLALLSASLGRFTLTPYDLWLTAFANDGWAGRSWNNMPGRVATGVSLVFVIVSVMLATIPSMIIVIFNLVLARLFLIRRAFVTSSSAVLRMFRVLDRFFVWLNERTTRGVELVRDTDTLPEFQPIAWRERTRKSLGKARYLFRVLTLLEVPTMSICAIAAQTGAVSANGGLWPLLIIVWLLAALIITVKGSTAISGERAHETMEALLSTPMTSREILTEKVAGMSRLMMVLAIPILTIHATLFTMSIGGSSLFEEIVRHAGAAVVYGLLTLTATWLAMQFLAWFSTGIGMRFHSQSRSILISVCAVTGCVVICFVVSETVVSSLLSAFSASYTEYSSDPAGRVEYQSEVTILLITERLLKYVFTPGGSMVLNEAYLGAAGSSGLFWRDRSSGIVFQNAAPQLLQTWSLAFACCGILVQAGITYTIRYLVMRWAPLLLNRRDQQSESASRSQPRDLPEERFDTALPDQSSGLPQAV